MKPEAMLRQKPIDYSTIYIDMDSFFASVEQYYNPRLRNKPVGVATGSTMGSSIIAASYIAKRAGIYTGIRVGEAIGLCPQLEIVGGNPSRYRRVHNEFMSVLHSTICRVRARGIDEAYLKVPSYAQSQEPVFALCKAIKASIYNLYSEHINCSIGIASNIWLAKMAASYNKPNGLFCVTRANLPTFYSNFKLTDLTGVGHRMASQFVYREINTPLNLYSASWRLLGKYFGVNGHKWYLRLRGYEVDDLPLIERKSLGHQVTVTGLKTANLYKITTYCIKIAEVLGYRLRENMLFAEGLIVQLAYIDDVYFNYKLNKLPAFSSNYLIVHYINVLLKKHKYISKLKRISITLIDLTSLQQLNFLPASFEPGTAALSEAIDVLENKYGSKVVLSASSWAEQSFSLDKIGFATDEMRKSAQH